MSATVPVITIRERNQVLNALKMAEDVLQDELDTRARSYEPNPTAQESLSLKECENALAQVRSALLIVRNA